MNALEAKNLLIKSGIAPHHFYFENDGVNIIFVYTRISGKGKQPINRPRVLLESFYIGNKIINDKVVIDCHGLRAIDRNFTATSFF